MRGLCFGCRAGRGLLKVERVKDSRSVLNDFLNDFRGEPVIRNNLTNSAKRTFLDDFSIVRYSSRRKEGMRGSLVRMERHTLHYLTLHATKTVDATEKRLQITTRRNLEARVNSHYCN